MQHYAKAIVFRHNGLAEMCYLESAINNIFPVQKGPIKGITQIKCIQMVM